MSEKQELSRSDLVRLRRERENKQRMQRAVNEATRPAPPVTRRSRQENSQPKRRNERANTGRGAPGARSTRSASRRFQVALLPVAPDAEIGGISISRPQLGRRLPSFLVVALLATLIYFAFNTPQLRVTRSEEHTSELQS